MDLLDTLLVSGTFLLIGERVLKLAATAVLAKLALRFGTVLIDKVFHPPLKDRKPYWEEKKAKTLSSLLKSILRYSVYFFTVLIVLELFKLPTASILTGAGIMGLAVGFGAQNLVRDVITGFFLIFEDQFAIGDYIGAAGVEGIVEEVGFRATRIRDFGGQLHIIPNGSIDKVSNFSSGNMRVMVEISIAYEESIDQASQVLAEVCQSMAAENPHIVEGPQVLGVQELSDSGVRLLLWAKTHPMEQWSVARELRRRAKERLDQAGIQIPYPHTVIIPFPRSGSKPGRVNTGEEDERNG